jgi:hypothetical protein
MPATATVETIAESVHCQPPAYRGARAVPAAQAITALVAALVTQESSATPALLPLAMRRNVLPEPPRLQVQPRVCKSARGGASIVGEAITPVTPLVTTPRVTMTTVTAHRRNAPKPTGAVPVIVAALVHRTQKSNIIAKVVEYAIRVPEIAEAIGARGAVALVRAAVAGNTKHTTLRRKKAVQGNHAAHGGDSLGNATHNPARATALARGDHGAHVTSHVEAASKHNDTR